MAKGFGVEQQCVGDSVLILRAPVCTEKSLEAHRVTDLPI